MLLEKENLLTRKIIGYCFEIHTKIGTGFEEKIYVRALVEKFKLNQISYETEKPYPVIFENVKVGLKRLDLVIEDRIILEIKSIKGKMLTIFRNQLLTYLKISRLKVGLLINFGNNRCEVKRLLNDPPIRVIR